MRQCLSLVQEIRDVYGRPGGGAFRVRLENGLRAALEFASLGLTFDLPQKFRVSKKGFRDQRMSGTVASFGNPKRSEHGCLGQGSAIQTDLDNRVIDEGFHQGRVCRPESILQDWQGAEEVFVGFRISSRRGHERPEMK